MKKMNQDMDVPSRESNEYGNCFTIFDEEILDRIKLELVDNLLESDGFDDLSNVN